MYRSWLLTLFAVIGLAPVTSAAPINYNETASGDLAATGFPYSPFTFGAGTNTVTGVFGIDGQTVTDFDGFAFVIPDGRTLVSARVTLTDVVGDLFLTGWTFNAGSASAFSGTPLESVTVNSPGSYTFVSTPLGANTYNVTPNFFAGVAPDHTSRYVFTFEVIANPEPMSMAVFGGLAVAGIAGYRRRKQATV